MSGRERDPHASWIVARNSGHPTGYADNQKHACLTERERIIESPDDLRRWLADPE
jgi:hypothetical protein